MEGGVAVQAPLHVEQPVGFFHMPKMQVPNYQRSRVHVPFNTQFQPAPNLSGQSVNVDNRMRQNSGGMPGNTGMGADALTGNAAFDGKRMRKAMVRKTVDYNTTIVKYLEERVWQRDGRDARAIQPDTLYQLHMTPPSNMQQKPMNCLTTKFMRQSTNKFRCPIFCVAWTPEGRRLVTGASSGEFTLWNGLTFSFETILQAHETSCRAMQWSHNDQWMVTADHAGYIKYWQTNMNNVKMYQGHKEAIRGLSFCPSDAKFASCSDDSTVRVWDFLRCHEERILRGHGADVKCIDWHPTKSLIASGSKDNQVPIKLWDPKSGTSLATLHAHKFTVMDLQWNKNGNWLLTAARDHLVKLFDIRNLKEEVQVFKGHKKEATSVAWHPINEQMFATGGSDGAIMFWNAGTEKEVGAMEEAHDAIIWDLAWHPLGHVLTSASNDHSTKFWTRNRPGDAMRDRYNLNIIAIGPDGEALDIDADMPLGDIKSLLPGMGLEHGLPPVEEEKPDISKITKRFNASGEVEELPCIPGLDWGADAEFFKQEAAKIEERPRKKQPYSRPIPRSFEQAWITNQQPGTLVKDQSDGSMKKGKLQSLLSLSLPEKPPPGLEYVDLDTNNDDNMIREPVGGFNPDHPPAFDGGMPPGDQDYRSDQDYRQDQDLRADQDYRADMEYDGRSRPHGGRGGGFDGTPRGRGGKNFRGERDNGPRGQFRGRRGGGGFQGDRDRDFEDMEQEDFGGNYGDNDGNFGNNQGDHGNRFGDHDGPNSQGAGHFERDGSFDQERMDIDHQSPNRGRGGFNRGRGRGGDREPGVRGRGGQDGGFRGRGRDRNQSQGGVGGQKRGWNDDGGDEDYNDQDDSQFGGRGNYQGGNDRGNKGNRGGRGGRGGGRGGNRGRGGGGGRGGQFRGRGKRGDF